MDLLQEYMEDGDAETLVRKFHQELDPDQRLEFVSVLEKMLWFGPSQSMKRFVRLLLNECEISTGMKCRMAEQVYDADDPMYVEKIRFWINQPDMNVVCRIEWIDKINFYSFYTTEQKVDDWMNAVFSLVADDTFYRFKLLMTAFTTYETMDLSCFLEILKKYKTIYNDPVMNKIMMTEKLLDKPEATDMVKEYLEELMGVLQDNNFGMDVQADVCDFFLHTEKELITNEMKKEAQRVMSVLFQENMTSSLSLFANRQNVHSESIEKSSEEILEQLHSKYCISALNQPLHKCKTEIEGWSIFKNLSEDEQSKVVLCFHRIQFDNRVYGKTNDSLQSIFGLVWKHVHKSDHQEELQKRLLEEMMEGAGKCSSGIAVRLLNTLSGFDDFMLKISYKDAILAKVMMHLNRVIMESPDQEQLLEEMTMPNSQYLDRKHFLSFFRQEIPKIKELLYDEYTDVLTDTDFDLYLKQALVHYEGA